MGLDIHEQICMKLLILRCIQVIYCILLDSLVNNIISVFFVLDWRFLCFGDTLHASVTMVAYVVTMEIS